MKERMRKWSMFFGIVGWISVIVGIVTVFLFIWAAAITLISVGLCCLFSCAVLEWMDGLTDQLIESREIQQRQLTELLRIGEQFNHAEQRSNVIAPQTGTPGRRRAVREEAPIEPEPKQEGLAQFDAQHIADVYRMAQSMER